MLGWTYVALGLLAAASDDYAGAVKPLLARRCYACHGALKQKAGLRLDTVEAMRRGGTSGPAIEPGNADESLLIARVCEPDLESRMPPEGEPVSAAEIATIRSWIDSGAEGPAGETPQIDPKNHWSFHPPRSIPNNAAQADNQSRNPIDGWISAEHAHRGLIRVPEADRATLLRRVALDLTGLAPTPDEVAQFVLDSDPDAYERAVDRLLASPRYGERWGRHWLDIWRYSDWDGFGAEIRESQPHIWQWRDWVVESLNADKSYVQMISEMIAGDELEPENPKTIRATGYLVRNWYKFNRNIWLDSTVEHTSKAFLGVTLNCARCHDHKYDPIAQADYYRFKAIFEPHEIRTDPMPGDADTQKRGLARVYDAKLEAPTYLFHRGDEKEPDSERPLVAGIPSVLGALEPAESIALPPTAHVLALRAEAQRAALIKSDSVTAEARASLDKASAALAVASPGSAEAARLDALRDAALKALTAAHAEHESIAARIAADEARYRGPAGGKHALVEAFRAAQAERNASIFRAQATVAQKHAEYTDAQAKAGADLKPTLTALHSAQDALRAALAASTSTASYTSIAPVYPATSTGRRTALARWIARDHNPLTARVAVNHVWMRHFGRPLVDTVFDFGLNGAQPTHPEVLDALAIAFRDSGWSLKHLHRLIVTSATYRMASTGGASENAAADPQNRFLWRMNPRRIEAELVRDNILYAAGTLESVIGGPDLDPGAGLTSRRRSLYFRHAKEKRVTFLKLFDSANATACYRRDVSVVPQQALALTNSALAIGEARRLAATLSLEASDQAAFVDIAFLRVLGRAPSEPERDTCLVFLNSEGARLANATALVPFAEGPDPVVAPSPDPRQRAREDLILVLFNHHEFVTIR